MAWSSAYSCSDQLDGGTPSRAPTRRGELPVQRRWARAEACGVVVVQPPGDVGEGEAVDGEQVVGVGPALS